MPDLLAGRGGETDEVGLNGARDQNRIGALKPGLPQVELELAHLVATERQVGAVVPLDVDSRPAQRLTQIRHSFQGGGQAAEPQPRKLAQGSQPRFCRHLELPEIRERKEDKYVGEPDSRSELLFKPLGHPVEVFHPEHVAVVGTMDLEELGPPRLPVDGRNQIQQLIHSGRRHVGVL